MIKCRDNMDNRDLDKVICKENIWGNNSVLKDNKVESIRLANTDLKIFLIQPVKFLV
jgi:hypothetical protein